MVEQSDQTPPSSLPKKKKNTQKIRQLTRREKPKESREENRNSKYLKQTSEVRCSIHLYLAFESPYQHPSLTNSIKDSPKQTSQQMFQADTQIALARDGFRSKLPMRKNEKLSIRKVIIRHRITSICNVHGSLQSIQILQSSSTISCFKIQKKKTANILMWEGHENKNAGGEEKANSEFGIVFIGSWMRSIY